jgi:hypothetical protein
MIAILLVNQPALLEKEQNFTIFGGGVISVVSNNQKLFSACLSSFWLCKMPSGHPNKITFPAKTKTWREQMGWTL